METRYSFCRLCPGLCGIRVDVEDGRAVKVIGDKDNPSTFGYTCKKGRSLPDFHYQSQRVLHPLRKLPDGSHERIASEQALDEIAAKLKDIVDRYGPRSVALYTGTFQMMIPPAMDLAKNFFKQLGSPMIFCSGMIDQPGKPVAMALHGNWEPGAYPFDHSDVWLMIGANPLVSMWGGLSGFNPARSLKIAKEQRGLKLIVVDPRRSESAEQADLYLQIRPGEDPTFLAGIVHVIIEEGLYDKQFVADEADGLDELRAAVASFTPDYVAKRCGLPRDGVIEAARIYAAGTRGSVSAGTGPNMAGRGTLTEYLILALHTLCGRWLRAGERVFQPNALMPEKRPRAQTSAPRPGWGFGEKMRVRGLTDTAGGMPTAGLADEMLIPGEGRVRAMITMCGNPITSWPDQLRTYEALQSLELLVSVDPKRNQTAKLAHYIIPPPMSLEVPSYTRVNEGIYYYGVGNGLQKPFAQYTDAVVSPPEGSDLLHEWEFFYGLAQRLGLQLELGTGPYSAPIDMENKPETEDLYRALARGSRIPFDEVKAHVHGHVFDDESLIVGEKCEGHAPRLQIGDPTMMGELRDVAAETVEDPATSEFPFRMISRRLRDFINSSGVDIPLLTRNGTFNPAYMNPEDLEQLGLSNGDEIVIESARAQIFGIVEAAPDVRPGAVSMAHGWGDTPEHDGRFREIGSPTGRLTDNEQMYDPYHGLPRMSSIPVRIRRKESNGSAQTRTAQGAAQPVPLV